MNRAVPALLGIALTAGAVAAGGPASAAAAEDNTAPTASYKLDSTAVWAGQRVQLDESGLTDDTTPATPLVRQVAWGDSNVETLPAGVSTFTHTYASTGTFPVRVTLSDDGVEGTGVFTSGSTVTVTTSPGTYGWKKSPIYVYPGYMNEATMQASGIPAKADQVWTAWGDGETGLLAQGASATVPHWFGAGIWTPRITLENDQGRATPVAAKALSVRADTSAPSVSVTVPGSPHKSSSWKTIKGKVKDSQAGVDVVGVVLWKYKGNVDYIYDFGGRRWIKSTPQTKFPDTVVAQPKPDASGTWKVTSSGLTKGYNVEVDYYAYDQVGNRSATKWVAYKLTS